MKSILNNLNHTQVRSFLVCCLALMLSLGFVSAVVAQVPTVVSDKPDYYPGEKVVFTGERWQPGETVLLVLNESHPEIPDSMYAVADNTGHIYHDSYVIASDDLGVYFNVTATGLTSGLVATNTFTDASGITFLRNSPGLVPEGPPGGFAIDGDMYANRRLRTRRVGLRAQGLRLVRHSLRPRPRSPQ